jgi:hypothetical protein
MAGKNLIITSRESLVCDILAGDGEIGNLLLQCTFDASFQAILLTCMRQMLAVFYTFLEVIPQPNDQWHTPQSYATPH